MASGLAKGLLVNWATACTGALAIFAMTGCFVPSDDRPLSFPPASSNRPPRIVESSAQPSERTKVINNGPGCRLDFSVFVEDPDVDDSLTVNWYVDYDPNTNPSYYGLQKLLRNNGSAVRPDPASLSIDFSSANPLPVGPHLVEVLVSDGQLINRSPQTRALADGGTDPTYVAVWSWLLKVQAGDCP